MTLFERIKINLDYLLGKAAPKLYAEEYKSPNLTLKDWQKRWDIFSANDCGFIWYAVDLEGNLAEFTSEEAYVPETFFQNVEANKKLSDFFDSLPDITESLTPKNLRPELKQLAIKLNHENSFWKIGANKGLFIFDEMDNYKRDNNLADSAYNYHRKPYELMLIPEKPLKESRLPLEIRDLLKPYRFQDVKFSDCQFLDVSKYFYSED